MKHYWNKTSWQSKNCQQQIEYADTAALNQVIQELAMMPPLVTPLEIERLKHELAKASRGEAFILQGGDCAESFSQCNSQNITNKLKILLQMSLVLIHGLRKPVIRIGRIAGQYAKPRSSLVETRHGQRLPSYRGDLINKTAFDKVSREPDPKLMLQGYHFSSLTLNYIRALMDGGFADLEHPEYWQLDFVRHSEMAEEYQVLVNDIMDSLDFVKKIAGIEPHHFNRVGFYTSHEGLNLYYEQALTRLHQRYYYLLSTHFPWIGMRTADVNGAHVEFFRGIHNPIAIKIGPDMTAEWLVELMNLLNPQNEFGKLVFIVRLGVNHIQEKLPLFIDAVQQTGKSVLWMCDPMHGNTTVTPQGYKTRDFDDILKELEFSFQIHQMMNSYLGGIHFELTGENVTECTGGARGLTLTDLPRAYESLVDPRLNYEQSLEMAMLIAKLQQKDGVTKSHNHTVASLT